MTNEIPKKCPKCGAGLKRGWENVYECESMFHPEGAMAAKMEERGWCFKLQIDLLAARVEDLEAILTGILANDGGSGDFSAVRLGEFRKRAVEALKVKGSK